jgi:hypothetical protein
MSFDDQLLHSWSRCQEQVCRLRMLAMNEDCLAPSGHAVAEVRDATNAVIAELEAMSRTALGICRRAPGTETFLWVRVARLTLAADQAADAACRGDLAALRSCLRHFDTLVSAIWTVQNAICGQEPSFGRVLLESDMAVPADLPIFRSSAAVR